MNLLRRASTRGIVVAAAATAVLVVIVALAVAAVGSDAPRPPAEPLGQAIRAALAAPAPGGVSARISYSQRVVGSSGLASFGGLSLLGTGSGRLWIAGDGHARLELSSLLGDTEILYDGAKLTLYVVPTGTAYELALPQLTGSTGVPGVPSRAAIDAALALLSRLAGLLGAQPDSVAGRPAYTVRLSPGTGSHGGSVVLSFDAETGMPLRLSITAPGSSSPLLELAVTAISYGPVAASDVDIALPASVKIVPVRGA